MPLPTYDGSESYYALGSSQGSTQKALNEYGKAIASSEWIDIDANTSLRRPFTQDDYDYARPEDSVPVEHHKIMAAAENNYQTVGLVRNVIDLISDFACRGIRISHPNKTIESFYRNWFERVNGRDRSERFLNNLYKYGNVIIERRWATLSQKDKKDIQKSKAEDLEKFEHIKPRKRRIPSRYIFLNPQYVYVIGGELASFTGQKLYGIKLTHGLQRKIKQPSEIEKSLVDSLPQVIKDAAQGAGIFPLPPENTLVYFYKKDDWQTWAKPMMYSVFRSLNLLRKLELTDFAALDSVIDHVRIFKLGSLEHRIMPGAAAFEKLRNMLYVNHGAGVRTFVWGPDISIEESQSKMHEFLGDEKYKPTLNAIYAGLGIPPTLTGTSTAGGGTTNNLISLKSLIKRLDYGRAVLLNFWNTEIAIIQKSLGHKVPAIIEFDDNNLGDEEAEKKLFIELADRAIISDEFVQQKFGADATLELSRLNKEERERRKNKRVPKGSPYHNPDWEKSVKGNLLLQGKVTPSQVDVHISPISGDEEFLEQEQQEVEVIKDDTDVTKKKAGRPPNSKDTVPRKRRRFVPKTKAIQFWAHEAQDKIAELLNPVLLEHFNKKNMRSLSQAEVGQAEKIRFDVLCAIKPLTKIDEGVVFSALQIKQNSLIYKKYKKIVGEVQKTLGRQLNFQELRDIQVEAYIFWCIKR